MQTVNFGGVHKDLEGNLCSGGHRTVTPTWRMMGKVLMNPNLRPIPTFLGTEPWPPSSKDDTNSLFPTGIDLDLAKNRTFGNFFPPKSSNPPKTCSLLGSPQRPGDTGPSPGVRGGSEPGTPRHLPGHRGHTPSPGEAPGAVTGMSGGDTGTPEGTELDHRTLGRDHWTGLLWRGEHGGTP